MLLSLLVPRELDRSEGISHTRRRDFSRGVRETCHGFRVENRRLELEKARRTFCTVL